MDMEKLHKVGKYGSHETYIDESNSRECIKELFTLLCNKYEINGYHYCLLNSGISDRLYYERDNAHNLEVMAKEHRIIPDITTIIIVKNGNNSIWYPIISGDDKYQETLGNAIERLGKNFKSVFWDKVCFNLPICPYVIFCSGKIWMESDYEMNKLRQMLPYTRKGEVHLWHHQDEHGIYKDDWNELYVKDERFTKEEKYEILQEVAIASVKYYKDKFNKNMLLKIMGKISKIFNGK